MQADLTQQTQHLDSLLGEIEEKKAIAERYAQLAETNQEKFSAFRQEMEAALRRELDAQSENGKSIRRFASSLVWLITLVVGGALGAYFKDIVTWISAIWA